MVNNSSSSNITFDAYDNKIYQTLIDFNGCLAFIVGGFGVYITWFWTPQIFGPYKYFLLNISLWAFLFDTYTTVFYTPWILYPAIVCCPTGFLRTRDVFWAKIWSDLLTFFHGGTNVAVFSAFIYRFAILKGKLQIILGPKFLTFLVILHIIYEVPTNVFFHLCTQNTTAINESILKHYPNIIEYYPNDDMACAVISLDVGFPFNYLFFGVGLFSFFATMPFIVIMVYQTKNLLRKQKINMNEKTYLMHKELLRTLIFQLVVPGVTLLIPYAVTLLFIIVGISNISIISQANFIVGTLHSTMNTVMMLYFIRPYRYRFTNVFWKEPKSLLTGKWATYWGSRVIDSSNVVDSINRKVQN